MYVLSKMAFVIKRSINAKQYMAYEIARSVVAMPVSSGLISVGRVCSTKASLFWQTHHFPPRYGLLHKHYYYTGSRTECVLPQPVNMAKSQYVLQTYQRQLFHTSSTRNIPPLAMLWLFAKPLAKVGSIITGRYILTLAYSTKWSSPPVPCPLQIWESPPPPCISAPT